MPKTWVGFYDHICHDRAARSIFVIELQLSAQRCSGNLSPYSSSTLGQILVNIASLLISEWGLNMIFLMLAARLPFGTEKFHRYLVL